MFVAAIFSAISLFVTFLAIYTQREVFMNQNCAVVHFAVHGLTVKDRKLQLRTKGIALNLAIILGIDKDLIYIEQPRGFRFKVNLYVNYEQQKNVDHKAVLEDALMKGTLGEIIRDQWELQKLPVIKDLIYDEVPLENDLMNTMMLSMSRLSMRSRVQAQKSMTEPEIFFKDPKEGTSSPRMTSAGDSPLGAFSEEES